MCMLHLVADGLCHGNKVQQERSMLQSCIGAGTPPGVGHAQGFASHPARLNHSRDGGNMVRASRAYQQSTDMMSAFVTAEPFPWQRTGDYNCLDAGNNHPQEAGVPGP